MQTISIQSRLVDIPPLSVRRPAAGPIGARIAGLPLTLELRNLNLAGFAVVTTRPFWRGMTHRFTFSSRSGFEITLVAKAVHSAAVTQDGDRRFVTGWEFMVGSAEKTAAAMGQLFEAAAEATRNFEV